VVRGGWDGHRPVEQTDAMLPYLRSLGLEVLVSDSAESYADAELMARVDLVVQYVSMESISDAAVAGLRSAVAAGTGFAGWHGGIADSFRASSDYLQLVGGQFTSHPGGVKEHVVTVVAEHPIVAGLTSFTVTTEQYWPLTDSYNTVLAQSTHAAEEQWHNDVTVPVVWTRLWGAGRVFVCTLGHDPAELDNPVVRGIIERGIDWARRRPVSD
jgi:type 1 glutamine amidotransferase